MRAGIVVNVTREDRRRLEAIVADRSAPQKHVWRANIILATAAGCGTPAIMRRSGKAKPVVWTWQAATVDRHRAAGGRLDVGAATCGSNPLDRPGTGQGGRGEPAFGATHSRSPSARAAP